MIALSRFYLHTWATRPLTWIWLVMSAMCFLQPAVLPAVRTCLRDGRLLAVAAGALGLAVWSAAGIARRPSRLPDAAALVGFAACVHGVVFLTRVELVPDRVGLGLGAIELAVAVGIALRGGSRA
jgi:hypothetical protein